MTPVSLSARLPAGGGENGFKREGASSTLENSTRQRGRKRSKAAGAHPAKSELVRRVALEQAARFTLGDLTAQLRAASPRLVKKVPAGLKREGKVRLSGKGRGACRDVVW